MSEPLISIVTPTFNHVRFIERCVRSVLRQTYRRWEMVIVDDASDDGTLQAARKLATQSSQIHVIAHARRRGVEGLADSYNEALSASRGELIAVLEGDDWWAPDRLARQVAPLAEDDSVVLAFGDCWEVSETGGAIGYVSTPVSHDSPRSSGAEAVSYFSRLRSFPASTVLIRREALERVGGFRSEGLPLVDYPTWLSLSLEGDFLRVSRPISYWRRHSGSVSWKNLEQIANGCHETFLRFIERNGPEIRKQGLSTDTLARAADAARVRLRASLPYFDAKCELFCGDRFRAVRKFFRLAWDPRSSLGYRAAGVVGLGAGLSSRNLFSVALALRRSAKLMRIHSHR
jgi:glycosyltransferase involved in cell wall biosynthesis